MPNTLAPYAVSEANSRGRKHPVDLAHDRNAFQRDYTRILHSQAFRRLQHKTQVFSSNVGDRFRTRMSHSLEVEQLASSICRQLDLNADLAATLAIAHDIGHAPFGHLGQDVLNELMQDHGGFEHNYHALRLVDVLESPYIAHEGLNLMFETREGLLKHCTPERARKLGDEVARRHLDGTSPPLESQAVDFADAIAYVHADLEDAFIMKILTAEELLEAPGYAKAWQRVREDLPGMAHPTTQDLESGSPEQQRRGKAIVQTVIRHMLTEAVDDLVMTTRRQIALAQPQSLDDVRRLPPLVGFSVDHQAQHRALKRYSRSRIYEHPSIMKVRAQEHALLIDLFRAYEADPTEMSGRGVDAHTDRYEAIADHIAGMTDRYAWEEWTRINTHRPELLQGPSPTVSSAEPTGTDEPQAPRRRMRM